MHFFEKYCIALRHSRFLKQQDGLWHTLRPYYNRLIALLGKRGLKRNINGTDPILIHPRFRGFTEVHEPEVWTHLMSQIKPGDVVVDVGANIGLYTVAMAKRVAPGGKVFAFEPDPYNFTSLKSQVELNEISNLTEIYQTAVGNIDGKIAFDCQKNTQSHIDYSLDKKGFQIECVRLDTILRNKHIDIIKIDVEGFEEKVLEGASHLLSDKATRPRFLYIEVHPFAWPAIGVSDQTLLKFLNQNDYRILTNDDNPVDRIDKWGEIVAYS